MFPRFYAILDADLLADRSQKLTSVATELHPGLTFIQYRNKQGSARAMLQDAARLRELPPANGDVRLLLPGAFTMLELIPSP